MKIYFALGMLALSFGSFSQNPCLHFDGIDDQVNLGSSVGNDIRTIEMWFRLNQMIDPNIPDYITLAAREVAGTNEDEFNLSFVKSGFANSGKLRFVIAESVAVYYDVHSNNSTWIADQWHHVAAVVHPSFGMMLYIDGIKQNDTDPFTGSTTSVSDDTYIGCWGDLFARYFNGDIDDVRFSTDGLYSSNFTPPCPDAPAVSSTVGLWHFNENSGTVASDVSGLGNNGVINGATWTSANICSLNTESIEAPNHERTLVKIIDLMGRETSLKKGIPLIYVYDDGTSERVFTLE